MYASSRVSPSRTGATKGRFSHASPISCLIDLRFDVCLQ
nr:MAG TPA: hypothetical protein [Caudoviricetes sp.]